MEPDTEQMYWELNEVRRSPPYRLFKDFYCKLYLPTSRFVAKLIRPNISPTCPCGWGYEACHGCWFDD